MCRMLAPEGNTVLVTSCVSEAVTLNTKHQTPHPPLHYTNKYLLLNWPGDYVETPLAATWSSTAAPLSRAGQAPLWTLRTRGAHARLCGGEAARRQQGDHQVLPPSPPCSGPLSPCTDFTLSDTVVQSSHVPLPHCFIIIKMLLCISFNHFKIKDELPRTFSLLCWVWWRQTLPLSARPAHCEYYCLDSDCWLYIDWLTHCVYIIVLKLPKGKKKKKNELTDIFLKYI